MKNKLKISDFAIIKSGKRLPKGSFLTSEVTPHPYVRTRDIKNNQIEISNIQYLQPEIQKEINRYIVKTDDLIISIVGTVGSCALIPPELDNANLTENCAKIEVDENIVNKKFLFYFLTSKLGQSEIFKNTVGSTQLKLPFYGIKNINIPALTLSKQKKISYILNILDEKIKLNKKMNHHLEDIPYALFRSWFINFDPVKAKAEGRPTGLSKKISDLFPNSFEESELGEIPKGWRISKFGDLVEPRRGMMITRSKTLPGVVPVVAGGIKPPYYHSKSNAVSPVVTISASGTAGYVNLYYEDIWASDCSYINKKVTDFVYFSHSFLKINQNKIYDLKHGAVQQHVYSKDLMELGIVISPNSLIEDYEKIVTPIHKKISNNLNEIKILSNLRDLLLPKLTSGELKIPDIEKLIKKTGAQCP